MLLPTEKPLDENFFHVEKIVRTKVNKKTKKKTFLVKYLHYPNKFNKWVPEEDIVFTKK